MRSEGRGMWPLGVAIVAMGLALGLYTATTRAAESGKEQGPQGAAAPPPPEVAFIVVNPEKATLTTELPGRTSPYLVAEVRPQVSGIIEKRTFTEGADVKEGEVLYAIDQAPYQAAHDLAVAGQARAEANIPPIELLARRQKDLVPTGAVGQQDYDQALANLKQAQAEVEYSKASVRSAKINLEYTSIKAPISGRIGRSNVTVGALATAYQGPPLATIQQLDPIYVDVPQSTAQMESLKKRLNNGQLTQDGANVNTVRLVLESGTEYESEGTLQFRDVTVDPTTGAVTLRILFPNPQEALLPGMFVRAIVTEGVNEQAILVPQQAVSRTPKGDPVVMLVNAEGKAEQRMITLDRTIGDKWLVSAGLASGDQVIVEGLQRLRPGAVVKAVPWESSTTQGAAPAGSSDPAAKTN